MHNIVQRRLAANILLMYNETTLFFLLCSLLRENGRYSLKNKLGHLLIKQLLNSVVSQTNDLLCSPLTNHDILFHLVQWLLIFVCLESSKYFQRRHHPIVSKSSAERFKLNRANDKELLLLLLRTMMMINTYTVKIRNYEAAYCFF